MDSINTFRKTLKDLEDLISTYEQSLSKTQQQDPTYRIIHHNDNPFDRASNDRKKAIETLKKDNERLRERLKILEAGNEGDVTRRIDDAVNSSDQIQILSKRVEELRLREEKILDLFRKQSREFREVCYLLTGYYIDPLKDNIFRLSHMYAERQDDRLYFEIKHDGTILLLDNEYVSSCEAYMKTYLEEADSFPAFLAAITLDLFKAQTIQTVDMSVTMIPSYEC